MDGRAIAAAAVSDGGLRRLTTELSGPRPAGTVAGEQPDRSRMLQPDAAIALRPTKP